MSWITKGSPGPRSRSPLVSITLTASRRLRRQQLVAAGKLSDEKVERTCVGGPGGDETISGQELFVTREAAMIEGE